MEAKAVQSASPRPEFCLFVRDFPLTTTDAELRRFFAPVKVKRGNIVRDITAGPPGVSKGYGFVHFHTEADMLQAIEIGRKKEFPDHRRLTVRPRDTPEEAKLRPGSGARQRNSASTGDTEPQSATTATRTSSLGKINAKSAWRSASTGANSTSKNAAWRSPSAGFSPLSNLQIADDADIWEKSSIRIGVYFGTFDPIHENHMAIAKHAVTHYQMVNVTFVPLPDSKFAPYVTPLKDRVSLIQTRIAVENSPGINTFTCFTDFEPNLNLNWLAKASICESIRNSFTLPGVQVEVFQLLGQNTFQDKSVQEALHSKHVRDQLHRTLLVFPRQDYAQKIEIQRMLTKHVQVAENFTDPVKINSLIARQSLSADHNNGIVHDTVFEAVKARNLYHRLQPSHDRTLIVVLGAPVIGKSTLSNFLSLKYDLSHFDGGEFYQASLLHAKYASFTASIRADVAKRSAFLSGTAELCMQAFFDLSQSNRFIVDGIDEKDILLVEKTYGHHCADILINMHCGDDILRSRGAKARREHHEEQDRRIQKYLKSKLVHSKQVRALVTSPRDMLFISIDAGPSVEEYFALSKLDDSLSSVLVSKPAVLPARVPITPDFISHVVNTAYATDAFTALCQRIEELEEPQQTSSLVAEASFSDPNSSF